MSQDSGTPRSSDVPDLPDEVVERLFEVLHRGDDQASGMDRLCREFPEYEEGLRAHAKHVEDLERASAPDLGESGVPGEMLLETIGPYQIVSVLGEGGMGTVYLGEHRELGRRAAIKLVRRDRLLDPAVRSRFLREMRILSRLDHPAICKVFESGMEQGHPYMAMQWIQGRSLAEVISTSPRAPRTRAEFGRILRWIEQAARALHVVHGQGVLHRDVTARNIMLDKEENVIVLDFGLARDKGPGDVSATASHVMVGTLPYMAPEQVRSGERKLDGRTDVYSLGIVLYQCLTLRLPFEGTGTDILRQIVHSDFVPAQRRNRAIPRDLQLVLEAALDTEPDRRYPTAEVFAEDLRRVRQLESVAARRLPVSLRTRRWVQRNPVAAVSIALLSTSTLVVSFLMLELTAAHASQEKAWASENLALDRERRETAMRLEAEQAASRARAEESLQTARALLAEGSWVAALRQYDLAAVTPEIDRTEVALGRLDAHQGLFEDEEARTQVRILRELRDADSLGDLADTANLRIAVSVLENPRATSSGLREALEIIESLVNRTDARLSPSDRHWAAAMIADEPDRIVGELQAALEADGRHLPSLRVLGPMLSLTGRTEELLRLADRYEARYQRSYEPFFFRAFAHAGAGNHDAVRALLASPRLTQVASTAKRMETLLGFLEELDRLLDGHLDHEMWMHLKGASNGARLPRPALYSPKQEYPDPSRILQKLFLTIARDIRGKRQSEDDLSWEPILHPWIRQTYAVQSPFQVARSSSLRNVYPERLALVLEALAPHDLFTIWKLLQPDELVKFRGLTTRLPGVERFRLHYSFLVSLWLWKQDQIHDGVTPDEFREASRRYLAEAILGARVSEVEFLTYLWFSINFELYENDYLADEIFVRWSERHGRTVMWHLARAEVMRERGAIALAQASLATALDGPPEGWLVQWSDHVWKRIEKALPPAEEADARGEGK